MTLLDPRFDGFPRSVLWTRGEGCEPLARLLAEGSPTRAEADLPAACLAARADLVVMASTGSFDLVATASPTGFDPDQVRSVVAAVGSGPHSALAAVTAARLAAALDVPGEVVSGQRGEGGGSDAEAAVVEASELSGLQGRVVVVRSAAALVDGMAPGTLLVLGAPGGSWLQRQFFGPGARLTSAAPGGTVVVRDAPLRAFHRAEPIEGLGHQMRVGDALLVATAAVHPVVDEGRLVGVVRIADLAGFDPDSQLGSVMESAPHASVFDALTELEEIGEFYDGAAVPVVDRDGTLHGAVPPGR
jgi:hypothetical protein